MNSLKFSLLVVILLRIVKMNGEYALTPNATFEALEPTGRNSHAGLCSVPASQQMFDSLRHTTSAEMYTRALPYNPNPVSTSGETDDLLRRDEHQRILDEHQRILDEHQRILDEQELVEKRLALIKAKTMLETKHAQLDEAHAGLDQMQAHREAAKRQREAAKQEEEAAAQQQRCAALLKALTPSAPKSNPSQHASVSAKKPKFPPPDQEIKALKQELTGLGQSYEDDLVRESLNTRIQELERKILTDNLAMLIIAMQEFCSNNPSYQLQKDLNEIVRSYKRAIDEATAKLNAFKRKCT
jgi:hypothetical protein